MITRQNKRKALEWEPWAEPHGVFDGCVGVSSYLGGQ